MQLTGLHCLLARRSRVAKCFLKVSYDIKMEKGSMKNLMSLIGTPAVHSRNKLTIVGVGQVGMACAYACFNQNVADEIALVDIFEDKVAGETMDLEQGIAFRPLVKVYGGTDYSVTKNSKVCIITAGARQEVGETRLELLAKNNKMFQQIIPQIVKHSPDVIILVVSNPVDVLTYLTWKLSGLPVYRIMGTGTSLDTARFKHLVAEKYGINIQSINMWVLGEHGDSSVPIWSSLKAADVSLLEGVNNSEDFEEWKNMHKAVVSSANEIIKRKGYTSWAIGLACADICNSIFHNTNNVHALSTLAKGFYGIKEEVFVSLPCVLGQNGISHVINLPLTECEQCDLQESASKLRPHLEGLI